MGVIGDTLSEARTRRAVDLEAGPIGHGNPHPLPARDRAGRLGRAAGGVLCALLHPQVRAVPRCRSRAAGRGLPPAAGDGGRPAARRRPRPSPAPPHAGRGVAPPPAAPGDLHLGRRRGGRGRDRRRGSCCSSRAAAGSKEANGGAGAATRRGERSGGMAGAKGVARQAPQARPGEGRRASATAKAVKLRDRTDRRSLGLRAQRQGQAAGRRPHPRRAAKRSAPFNSRSYTAAFGNGSVEVSVDGKPAPTPSSPSPIGFTVDFPRQDPRTPGRRTPQLRIATRPPTCAAV